MRNHDPVFLESYHRNQSNAVWRRVDNGTYQSLIVEMNELNAR